MEVSIIINTFNNESTIKRCLKSVVGQSLTDFECIVIDDCSFDQTRAICDGFIVIDKRIRVVHNQTNMGCSLTRKIGLEYSRGKYVVFIDGDDWMEFDYLEKMLEKAKKEDADLVYCDYYEEDGKTERYMPQNIDKKTKTQIIAAMASYDPFLISSLWNKLIRRDLVLKVVFPEERYGEDMYISLQLAYYSTKSSCLSDPLYHYWVNNSNSICNNKAKEAERRLAMYDICKKILVFLDIHYTDNTVFEPFLSIRMNKTSLRIFSDPVLRKKRDAFVLYPPAIKYLFRKEVQCDFVTKIKYYLCSIEHKVFRFIKCNNYSKSVRLNQ